MSRLASRRLAALVLLALALPTRHAAADAPAPRRRPADASASSRPVVADAPASPGLSADNKRPSVDDLPAPSAAPAARPADSASALERAKELFNAGARAYDAGHFEAAARALEEAYGLTPRPAILFSMAQAERQHYTLSHDPAYLQRASLHYRQYVEQAPQGARRVDAARALTEIEMLTARATELAPRLPAKPSARVLVTSPTAMASVRLDKGRPSSMPLVEEVAPGRHLVLVEAAGYLPEERLIVATDGGMVTLHVPLRELPARVAFAGAPPGARVSVDGRDVGTTPLAPLQVSPGRHAILVIKPGYRPYACDVLLGRGETAWVRVETGPTLLRAASYGFGVAAGAALIAGGTFLGLALYHERQASNLYYDERGTRVLTEDDGRSYTHARDARDEWRARGALALGAGAAFALGAVALYAIDSSAAPPPARAFAPPRATPGEPGDELSLRPFVGPGLGGVMVGGRF